MSEKLTADGWSFVKEREYVWLPRAQALQDRADAQHEALLKQAEALEACKAKRDALRKELESALSLMREHGIGLNAGTLDDAIRQALQAVIVERDNCVVLRSEWEARLQEIGDRLARTVQALADVPAAPVAEPCPVCNGTRMNLARDGRCRVCTPQGPPPRLDLMQEDAQPAPTTLDPALREPLKPHWVFETPNRPWVYEYEANARHAKLLEWIDGEPQRTRQAVADKLRQVRNLFRSTHLNMAAARVCNDLADELDTPPQQGGTEGREK